MEMISEQAIRKGFSNGINILEIQFQEMLVIALLNKNILTVVATIIDVIVSIEKQGWRTCHVDCLYYTRP